MSAPRESAVAPARGVRDQFALLRRIDAIQGLGAVFIEHISGSYSGVMGLPLYETAHLLQAVQSTGEG